MSVSPKLRRIAIGACAGAAIALTLFLVSRPDRPAVEPTDLQPAGRWHFEPTRFASGAHDQELARVLSLPYVAGTRPAPDAVGVLLYDPDQAFQGLNLYVSGHGPEALLVDMRGREVHRWRYPYERAFPQGSPTLDTAYFRRAHLFRDGELLVIFQGAGMIRLDRDSRLLWRSDLAFFNHLRVAADGRIFSIVKQAGRIAALRPEQEVLEDSIVVLGPDGSLVDRFSLLQCFAGSEFESLLDPLPGHADLFHTNTVELADSPPPDGSYPFRQGDLLVSLREIDVVAFIDPQTRSVRAAWRGPWRAQHQPVMLADGRLLLFDNRGLDGGSRVLEFDPKTAEIVWQYRGDGERRLASPEAGSCQRLPNGNTLITDSERGRAVEIRSDGTLVWEFVSPHRAGRRGELVATLFDVVRYPGAELEFVSRETR